VAVALAGAGFDLVEARDLSQLRAHAEAGVDIAVIDGDGAFEPLEAIRAVAAFGTQQIIVWSIEPDESSVLAAVRAGATGYLRRDISAAALVRSLRGAAEGESPLSREFARLLIAAIQATARRGEHELLEAILSPREQEILQHVARGEPNKQIAQALTISEFTVKRHVQNILRKLNLRSRHAAAALVAAGPRASR
jgi:two-component system nitrate/nitrite response regulator NarL